LFSTVVVLLVTYFSVLFIAASVAFDGVETEAELAFDFALLIEAFVSLLRAGALSVLPAVTDLSALPAVADLSVFPAVTDLSALPAVADLSVFPAVTDLSALPAVTDLSVLPAVVDIVLFPGVAVAVTFWMFEGFIVAAEELLLITPKELAGLEAVLLSSGVTVAEAFDLRGVDELS
jgi:hypothetical protein